MANKPFAIQDGITFPDGSIQTTAYTGSGTADANVWVQTFVSETGSPTDIVAMAVSVEYDSAGNVIALFSHYNRNDNSYYYSVGKYTTTGTKIWTARFADGFKTDGWGLAVAGNNYIYVAGQTLSSSESGYSVSTLTKLNSSDGSIEWSKVYDFSYASTSNVVDVASDGNPVMVGYVTEGDSYVSTVKVDAADGSIVWARLLDGQGNEEAYGMAVGPTGEVVAIGYMSQLGQEGDTDNHMLVVKYASDGTIAWQKAILFDAGYDCKGSDADIDSDGNIYVTGSYQYNSEVDGTTSALSILKLDSTGVKQWSRRVEGSCQTFGVSVVVGADDKLYLSGVTAFAGYTGVGEPDLNNAFTWVAAKYGFDGTVEWQRLIDHTDSWSFAGDIWFGGHGGGSNLAVKDGYVVFGGGFGNQAGSEDPRATVVQVSASGDVFATGAWAFTAASFSGLFNSSASDITVVDAEKTDSGIEISVVTATPSVDISAFLLGTLYSGGGSASSINNGDYHLRVTDTGSIVLPDGSEQTSAFVDAPSGPLPGFLRFRARDADRVVNEYFGWSGSGLWFEGNSGGGASYPVFTSFTIPGDSKTIVTVDFVYNEECSDPSIAIFTDGVIPEWSWGSDSTRIAASYNCPDPYIYGLAGSATNYGGGPGSGGGPIVPNRTYTARFTYDPGLGSDNVKLETLNSQGEIIDTITLSEVLPNQPYRVGFAADQDNIGGVAVGGEGEGGRPVKTYFKNLTIDVDGIGTDSDTLQGYDSTGYVANELKLGYAENTGWNWNYTLNGPTLRLGGVPDSANLQPEQVIITGPVPTETYPNAQRLILQGQRGYGEYGQAFAGEGGDVYIWGGVGGENDTYGASGGDVKLRGGQGQIDGAGGYVRIEGGRNEFGNGPGGFVEVTGGSASSNGAGGDVTISGGSSNAGIQGRVMIRAGNNSKNWLFDPTGTLTVPGDIRKATDLSIAVGTHPLLENVVVNAADTFGAGVWRMFFLVNSYPNLFRDITVGASVTTSWGTPVTATVQSFTQDLPAGYWVLTFYQDIATDFTSGDTVTFGPGCKTWTFDDAGNLTIPATGDIVRDGTSIFASSTALPVVTITNANFNQRDNPLPPAISTSEGAVVFTVTSPVALTATGLLLISGSNNKGGTIVTGGTTTGSQTLAFDMGGLNSTFTVVAFATTANGTSYSAPAGGHGGYICFPAGTMITLSNGTKKAIEDIIYSDDLLVWDFDQGAYASAKPIWIKASETASEYNLLTFSDGSVLKTVGNHHIFNKHAERFTHTMTADTPIGTVSFNEYGEEITLVSAEVVKETVEFYNVWTEYHLNMFAEGVLTSNRFNNTYPIVGMKFAKGTKELRSMAEFNGLDPKWIHGLRLQEQTAEHTAEYIKWYVSERLEKLSIDSTQLAG